MEAIDENITKKSSGQSAVRTWRFQAPIILGAIAFHIRSSDRCSIGASSNTIAACTTPRNGPPWCPAWRRSTSRHALPAPYAEKRPQDARPEKLDAEAAANHGSQTFP